MKAPRLLIGCTSQPPNPIPRRQWDLDAGRKIRPCRDLGTDLVFFQRRGIAVDLYRVVDAPDHRMVCWDKFQNVSFLAPHKVAACLKASASFSAVSSPPTGKLLLFQVSSPVSSLLVMSSFTDPVALSLKLTFIPFVKLRWTENGRSDFGTKHCEFSGVACSTVIPS